MHYWNGRVPGWILAFSIALSLLSVNALAEAEDGEFDVSEEIAVSEAAASEEASEPAAEGETEEIPEAEEEASSDEAALAADSYTWADSTESYAYADAEITTSSRDAVMDGDGTWLWPVEGVYHMSRGYAGSHNGLDITCLGIEDMYALATKAGVVIESSNSCPHVHAYDRCNGGCGNYVLIRHNDGTYSRYMHLRQYTAVEVGTIVRQGDPVGVVGSSGHSTGYHLHFEIFNTDGECVNPNPTSSRHNEVGDCNITYIYEQYPHDYTERDDRMPEEEAEAEPAAVKIRTVSSSITE